jgi:hypothetical protein
MAYLKGTHICSGIFPKLRVAMAFLNFVEIAMASVQLTQISNRRLQRTHRHTPLQLAKLTNQVYSEKRNWKSWCLRGSMHVSHCCPGEAASQLSPSSIRFLRPQLKKKKFHQITEWTDKVTGNKNL